MKRSDPRLYVIPGSHACRAAMLMFEHKALPWRERVLVPGMQTVLLPRLGFPGRTVPALTLNGVRVQGNRSIARFLDRIEPDPPLLPRHQLTQVEEAERFADEVLQPLARRLVLAAGSRDTSLLTDYGDSGRLGAILASGPRRRRAVMRLAYRHFGITPETEAMDLEALPGVLAHADSLAEAGALDGPSLNAADFQIAPSVCLLAYRRDLRDVAKGAGVWHLVERLLPAGEGGE